MYENQIARGIELLDKQHPGWREKINLDDLSIASSDRCIVGQLYGSFWNGAEQMVPTYGSSRPFWEEHGLYLERVGGYGRLTKEWKLALSA